MLGLGRCRNASVQILFPPGEGALGHDVEVDSTSSAGVSSNTHLASGEPI